MRSARMLFAAATVSAALAVTAPTAFADSAEDWSRGDSAVSKESHSSETDQGDHGKEWESKQDKEWSGKEGKEEKDWGAKEEKDWEGKEDKEDKEDKEWGGDHDKPKGGIHTGGGGLASPGVTGGGLAALGVLGTGMYALRRKKAAESGV
ncbi:hypothetical protein SGFS_078380 [Streptomyces graminofaciens]|uniref:Uncharacterized protein n=1 Tax=Streptomyces graminofaciens TaxID=68212 RepID=A0ABN5VSS9_9ACTN|nr:hypothetical protein [Streptomyces graminofaciens]BBC36544.1 hypothetical protein SGFS_078380 [Streptomyces graminofaciens]